MMGAMTGSRWRWAALFVVLTLFFVPQSDAAKRRRKARGKRAAPAAPMDSASGATLQERLNSLVNGNVSRSEIKVPGQKTMKNGMKCGKKPGRVEARVWTPGSTNGTLVAGNPADVRFTDHPA